MRKGTELLLLPLLALCCTKEEVNDISLMFYENDPTDVCSEDNSDIPLGSRVDYRGRISNPSCDETVKGHTMDGTVSIDIPEACRATPWVNIKIDAVPNAMCCEPTEHREHRFHYGGHVNIPIYCWLPLKRCLGRE